MLTKRDTCPPAWPPLARSQSFAAELPAQNRRRNMVVLDANVLTVVAETAGPGICRARRALYRGRPVGRHEPSYIGPATQVLRLPGKTVTPGFNDAHLHPSAAYTEDAPQYVVPCGPAHVRSIDELVAALKRKADKTPKGQIRAGLRLRRRQAGQASHLPRSGSRQPGSSDRYPPCQRRT